MLEALIVIIIIFWLLGYGLLHLGGLIHLLLVIALVVFIYRLITNRNI